MSDRKAETILRLENVSKSYLQGERSLPVIRDLSLSFARGEFACIMGPSGSGKSTLLHLIGTLDRPDAGRILFGERELSGRSDHELSIHRRRNIGFIFQQFHLVPSLTVLENVALPCVLDGIPFRQVREKALGWLRSAGLEGKEERYPRQLSGGEMQRVAIARAMMMDPALVLADEPTGSLDSGNARIVLDLLRSLAATGERTVIMVTHDPSASAFGNRLIRLKDGRIESDRFGTGETVY